MQLLAAGLVVALAGSACRAGEPSLSDYGPLPEFELRDQRDAVVRTADVRGRVLIVDFIFTTCPDVCPLLTEQLAGVRKQLAADGGMAYLSFSVDPEHDTPEKLKQFAALHGADQPDWYFLTGPLERVREVVTRGFKQAMEIEPEQPGKPRNVLHGSHFVLVDQRGTIRGFFRSDGEGVAALRKGAQHLLAERSRS